MLHSGIDLHKHDLVIATVDDTGRMIKEGRVRANRPAFRQYFDSLGSEQRAVVEPTATWYWLADVFRTNGTALALGHSKYIKAISYAKVKTDAVDAATLAQLLRSDLIPEAHMLSAELREPRDLLRQRLAPTASCSWRNADEAVAVAPLGEPRRLTGDTRHARLGECLTAVVLDRRRA